LELFFHTKNGSYVKISQCPRHLLGKKTHSLFEEKEFCQFFFFFAFSASILKSSHCLVQLFRATHIRFFNRCTSACVCVIERESEREWEREREREREWERENEREREREREWEREREVDYCFHILNRETGIENSGWCGCKNLTGLSASFIILFSSSPFCNIFRDPRKLVSIISTFYARVFRTKVCLKPNFKQRKDFCT